MIQHVSFDLWLTIIRSNKNFKTARLAYISDFLKNEFTEEKITTAFLRLSSLGDSYGEFFEKGFTAHQLYYLFFHQLFGKQTNLFLDDKNKLNTFVNDIGEIFVENCPLLISDEIHNTFDFLKRNNITCNIASNTSYANGKMLRQCMSKLRILDYFDFVLFSDEIEVFKPNPKFFKLISRYSKKNKANILHVGDNPLTDIKGAQDFGFKTLLFTPDSPNYSSIHKFTK